ncbi:MAG: hypothetical protein D6679_12630 [Candidatus Hydrogenedentota bacterium]|nr:MAG: hypothetical protein D6679_12630 [Candidatus Hydrogenedentota bacterium]
MGDKESGNAEEAHTISRRRSGRMHRCPDGGGRKMNFWLICGILLLLALIVVLRVVRSSGAVDSVEAVTEIARQYPVVLPEITADNDGRASLEDFFRSLPRFRNKRYHVLGPVHSAGKSFLTARLAEWLAKEGKNVLVIDADTKGSEPVDYRARIFGKEPAFSIARAETRDISGLSRTSDQVLIYDHGPTKVPQTIRNAMKEGTTFLFFGREGSASGNCATCGRP